MKPLLLPLCLASFLALVSMMGCQSGPRIYHVKGAVTFEGNPIPAGVIFFDPDVTKQNDGPQGFAFIKDGFYDTAEKGGKGVVGKAYLVRVQGFDGKPGEELPMGRPLFTDYQEAVDFPLEDSIRDFKVTRK